MKRLIPSPELERLAKKYVWWESAEWAFEHPEVFLANLMNKGCWDDTQEARKLLGDVVLMQVLKEAPPGYFNYRSWDYWHLKFKMTPISELPKRKL